MPSSSFSSRRPTRVTRRQGVRSTAALAATWVLLLASPAWAEGTAQLGTTQALRSGTTLSVDIVNPAVESIRWTGNGSVTVYGPTGTNLGTRQSGASITPTQGAGAYKLVVGRDQSIGAVWDVAVIGQTDAKGRLSAKNWQFNAGSFAQSAATNASFYALVPAGSQSSLSVIELKLSGLAGYIYDINANRRGVDGTNAGRSVPEAGNTVSLEYAIYVQVPTLANFDHAVPSISGIAYAGGVSTNVLGDSITPCDQVLPGQSQGYFSFNSTTEGSYQLQCDLNHDGSFSVGSGQDLLLLGSAAIGTNVVAWNGEHNGAPIPSGAVSCRVKLTVGEFHYVGRDIETSYPGMRLFRVNADNSRTGLAMYWNDNLVQANDAQMPNGSFGLVSSEGSVVPGGYADTVVANQNARSWGNFTGAGKGNVSYLDTYVWLDEATSATIQVQAADFSDSDGDGLTDFQESCLIGSEPGNPDTDANGVLDGTQYAVPVASAFSGLESNGRLSSALARRAIRRTRMSMVPGIPETSINPLEDVASPSRWLPSQLGDAAGVSDTPTDLLDVTNAIAVTGSDYVTAEGKRRGGALILTAAGGFYEHQKSICDRVRGANLLEVRPIRFRSLDVLQSIVTSTREGRLEYSMTLHLSEGADKLKPAVFWVTEDAPAVQPDASVVTIQVWGDSPTFIAELAESIVQRVELEQAIDWPRTSTTVDDADYVSSPEPDPRDLGLTVNPLLPSVLVENVSTLGGHVELALRRVAGAGSVQLQFSRLEQDGVTTTTLVTDASAGPATSHHTFTFDPFLEATIDVMDGGEVVDRVWASDGAWAAYDDSIWQGGPPSGTFSRTECENREFFASDEARAWGLSSSDGAVRLSGCGLVTRDPPAPGGVARALINPLDTGSLNMLTYWISVDRPYNLCLEAAEGRACVALPARRGGAWEAIPVSAFEGVSSAGIVTFATEQASEKIEVSGLTLLPSGVALRDTRRNEEEGCALSSATARTNPAANLFWGVIGLALGGRLLRRRR